MPRNAMSLLIINVLMSFTATATTAEDPATVRAALNAAAASPSAEFSRELQPLIDRRVRAELDKVIQIVSARVALLETNLSSTSPAARRAYHVIHALERAGAEARPATEDPLVKTLRARWRSVESAATVADFQSSATYNAEGGYAGPWITEALEDLRPYRVDDLAAQQRFAHAHALAKTALEALGDKNLTSALDKLPFAAADDDRLGKQRAALREAKSLRAMSHHASDACRLLFAFANVGPRQHLGHHRDQALGRVPAQAASGPEDRVGELKVRLRDGTARAEAQTRSWQKASSADRADWAAVSLAWADQPVEQNARVADRVCSLLTE